MARPKISNADSTTGIRIKRIRKGMAKKVMPLKFLLRKPKHVNYFEESLDYFPVLIEEHEEEPEKQVSPKCFKFTEYLKIVFYIFNFNAIFYIYIVRFFGSRTNLPLSIALSFTVISYAFVFFGNFFFPYKYRAVLMMITIVNFLVEILVFVVLIFMDSFLAFIEATYIIGSTFSIVILFLARRKRHLLSLQTSLLPVQKKSWNNITPRTMILLSILYIITILSAIFLKV